MWATVVPVGEGAPASGGAAADPHADLRRSVSLLESAVQILRDVNRSTAEEHCEDVDALFGEAIRLAYDAVALAREGSRRSGKSGSVQVSPSKGISMELRAASSMPSNPSLLTPIPAPSVPPGTPEAAMPRTPRRTVTWKPSRGVQRIEIAFSKLVYSVTAPGPKSGRQPPCCTPTQEKIILNGTRAMHACVY